jgi:hypothetical protein
MKLTGKQEKTSALKALATKSPPSSSFPVMLGDASEGDYKLAKAIHDSTQSGVPIV